jgi:hypothetical protein
VHLPPDPFLGDPDDPTGLLADLDTEDDDLEPLSEDERGHLVDDLAEIEVFAALLEPEGVKGLLVWCEGCEEDHYFAWEILRANLTHIVEHGIPRVHEPPFQPDPDDYVSMDYARGFVDGVTSLDEEDD